MEHQKEPICQDGVNNNISNAAYEIEIQQALPQQSTTTEQVCEAIAALVVSMQVSVSNDRICISRSSKFRFVSLTKTNSRWQLLWIQGSIGCISEDDDWSLTDDEAKQQYNFNESIADDE